MLVGHVFRCGAWEFEIKSLCARKVKPSDDSQLFSGVGTINITDGIAHIEGFYCSDFNSKDVKDFKHFIVEQLGILNAEWRRFNPESCTFKQVKKGNK